MGKRSRKYFLGIFEDGPVLKIAQLINSNGHPILVDIKKTEMDTSIYHDLGFDQTPQQEQEPQGEEDFTGITELNIEETSELDSVVNPHEHLLSIFPLSQSRISLNANDEKLTTHYLERSIKTLNKKDLVKLSLLSSDDLRDKDVTWGILTTAQDQTCVIIHKGENRLLSYLQKYNQIQSEKKYFYSLIDSNDISVLNVVRLNYELNKEDDVLVIYLGYDYKKGILMKGNEFVKSLPILTSSDGSDLQREITSKLTLYQDEMEIPHVERIIVAGEFCQDEMIAAIAESFPAAEVERFKFTDLLFSENLTEELPEEELSSYIIPISLAWKNMSGKSNEIIQTNFLEKKIIKSQKLVQFSWHSFIMLALLLGISFSYTTSILQINQKADLEEKRYWNKKETYEKIQSEHDPGPDIQAQIDQLQAEINLVKEFYKDKAIWSDIMERLSLAFKENPTSWLTNIQGNDESVTILGTTTDRKNITKFSKIFPEGLLQIVNNKKYLDQDLWLFEIRFSYLPAIDIVKNWNLVTKKDETTQNNSKKLMEIEAQKSRQENKETKRKEQENPIFAQYRKITEDYYSFEHDSLLLNAQNFIDKYPGNILSVNCRYLMSEVYFRRNQIDKALKLLDEVLLVESPMEPFALYKSAQIYHLKNMDYLALVNLNLIKSRFPDSEVIPKAEKLKTEIEVSNE